MQLEVTLYMVIFKNHCCFYGVFSLTLIKNYKDNVRTLSN